MRFVADWQVQLIIDENTGHVEEEVPPQHGVNNLDAGADTTIDLRLNSTLS